MATFEEILRTHSADTDMTNRRIENLAHLDRPTQRALQDAMVAAHDMRETLENQRIPDARIKMTTALGWVPKQYGSLLAEYQTMAANLLDDKVPPDRMSDIREFSGELQRVCKDFDRALQPDKNSRVPLMNESFWYRHQAAYAGLSTKYIKAMDALPDNQQDLVDRLREVENGLRTNVSGGPRGDYSSIEARLSTHASAELDEHLKSHAVPPAQESPVSQSRAQLDEQKPRSLAQEFLHQLKKRFGDVPQELKHADGSITPQHPTQGMKATDWLAAAPLAPVIAAGATLGAIVDAAAPRIRESEVGHRLQELGKKIDKLETSVQESPVGRNVSRLRDKLDSLQPKTTPQVDRHRERELRTSANQQAHQPGGRTHHH